VNNGLYTDVIQVRNDKTLRKLFAELMRHRTVKENERVRNREDKQEDEFSVENIQEKTEATNAEYAAPILKKKDPKNYTRR
jgi:hypothetical protein